MKLIEFKEYDNFSENRTLNKKKIAGLIIILCIIITVIILSVLYMYNKKFRNWADIHILMKTVNEGSLASIDIDANENTSIYAYDKYIASLNVNKLNLYNSSGNLVTSLDMNINNPMFASNGKYLVVAEKDKQKLYLVSETKKVWENKIDGFISRISVNENGYVSVVCSGTTYKSVIIVFNQTGEQLFKTYIPTNSVIDVAISSDNKYMSYAEVDTSKTLISSTIKTISIKDTKSASESAIVNTYELPVNNLVINIKYQGSKNLLCMSNTGIYILNDGNIQDLLKFEDEKKYVFAGIKFLNTVYGVEEINSEGINEQKSKVTFINSGTKKQYDYEIEGIAKETVSAEDNIAINLGTEAYFLNSKGFLIKKYVANQEIRDIKVSGRIAAIIFKDKIEILIL